MIDVLSDVLSVARLKGTVYFSAELRSPWGIALPRRPRAPFYVVTRGRCEIALDVPGSPPASLGSGDLAILPGGTAHTVASSRGAKTMPLDQFVARYPMDERGRLSVLDRRGPATTLLGGFFELERAPEPLVDVLPPLIHLRGSHRDVATWLAPILKSIAQEAAQALPGRAVVLNRLADVLFVKAVRAWLLTTTATNGAGPPNWLRGLADPRIARALGEIHRTPEQALTLGRLASLAAMSRTAFAQRFRALVGTTPVTYLTSWRMQKAAYLLEMGTLSIAQIAERVGYSSELGFAKAFRRRLGTPPGAYARRASRSRTG
ncbi:MAG TPA: AraC family transcriptional regulator [Methylomirabilota bacterium]|nr:AraC family transcriptional regulator [Methylomirabilota bacterium]